MSTEGVIENTSTTVVYHRRLLRCAFAGAILAFTTLFAFHAARGTIGLPSPQLALDPHGSFSAVRFPAWPDHPEVRFPDRLVAIDGRLIQRPPARPNAFVGNQVAAALEDARSRGAATVQLTFDTTGSVSRPLACVGSDEVAFFFGLYALVGWAIFASGVVVYLVARNRAPARAYGAWALGAALFFCTFYDYHSTASLVPLFVLGSIVTQLGFVWLAWAFPSSPQASPWVPKTLTVLSAAAAAVGVVVALSPWLTHDTIGLRVAVSQASPVTLVILAGGLGARFVVSEPARRSELRSAAYGLITVPLLIAVGFVLLFAAGSSAVHLLLPLATPLIPFAIAYSIVRHDILRSGAVLPSSLWVLPVTFTASACGLLAWLGQRLAGSDGVMVDGFPAVIGLLVAGLVVVYGRRFWIKRFFRATEQYRPTIDELSAGLGVLQGEGEIRAELRRLVTRWLPAEQVEALTVEEAERSELTNAELAALRGGEVIKPIDGLWVPLRVHGELCGVFRLGRKAGGELFTSEDVALLKTMASLGAIALHHAAAVSELEKLRRSQLRAARDERRNVLDTLSAEIAHELGHSLRYFRALFHDRSIAEPLDAEELRFALGEVERMDRMRRTLETLEAWPPTKETTDLASVAEHARMLLSDEIAQQRAVVSMSIAPDLRVDADRSQLVQVFVNLLRNALQAAGQQAAVGIDATLKSSGLSIEVWDNGPGVSEEMKPNLFRVWGVTTRKGGRGLGLMVCSRILHQLHWTIDFTRQGDRTVFRIEVPSIDVRAQ